LVGTGVAPGAAGGVVEAGDGVPVGDLLITNVHLVPMDLERVLRDHALLVRGGTIAWLGPAREADRIRAGRTIDGGGAYVVPGLVDMHVHVRDEDELSLYLLNGVTTVVNQSGRLEHLEMRERIRAGWLTRLGRDAPRDRLPQDGGPTSSWSSATRSRT
jgi:predicted amidohydrolase YtcJ